MPTLRLFFLAALSFLGMRASAQVANWCPVGTCDITNPIYVNVYWDANWDADVAADSGDFTMARIDALTNALVHSGYFSGLRQYSVTSASILPSIVETAFGAPPANLDLVIDQLGNLGKWIAKEHPELDPSRTILNVMIPPQIAPKDTNADFCKNYAGEHDQFGSPFGITFIPTWVKCNGNIESILATMSHEMVEATTDPVPASPTGWKAFADGEIGDKCEKIAPTVPFLFGAVQQYISDSLSNKGAKGVAACTVGFNPTAAPTFSSPAGSICGNGPSMTITVNGVFGPRPFDLSPFGNQTLYLQVSVIHNNGNLVFSAGNFLGFPRPDLIGFGGISWTRPTGTSTDKIVINGFVPLTPGGSIPVMSLGDSVQITVWSQASGQSATTTLPIATTGTLSLDPVVQQNPVLSPGTVSAGSTGIIHGSIQSGGCPLAGIQVIVSSSDASDLISSNPTPTLANGQFNDKYIARNAGVKTLTASYVDEHNQTVSSAKVTVTAYPTLDKLQQGNGTPAGGQTVTVLGTGFAPGTQLLFNGSPISGPTISSSNSMSFVTPRSGLPGDGAGNVTVSVSVDAETSNTLLYSYIVPDSPRIDFVSETCGVSSFSIDAYHADGTINSSEQIKLTAGYNAFAGGTQNNLTVTAGQTIVINGTGPITATDIANSALTTTVNIPLYPDLCGLGGGVPGGTGSSFQSGPNRYVPLPGCIRCGPGGIDVSIFTAPGDPNPGDFFALQGLAAITEARTISVAGVPAAELKSLISTGSIVFAQGVVAGDRIEFTGAAVQIGAGRAVVGPPGANPLVAERAKAAGRNAKAAPPQRFKSSAELSFAIPRDAAAKANYRILHLVQTKGVDGKIGTAAAAWAEVPVAEMEEENGSVKVKIMEPGIYALGVVVKGLHRL